VQDARCARTACGHRGSQAPPPVAATVTATVSAMTNLDSRRISITLSCIAFLHRSGWAESAVLTVFRREDRVNVLYTIRY
jgi:hypothetical protein